MTCVAGESAQRHMGQLVRLTSMAGYSALWRSSMVRDACRGVWAQALCEWSQGDVVQFIG